MEEVQCLFRVGPGFGSERDRQMAEMAEGQAMRVGCGSRRESVARTRP